MGILNIFVVVFCCSGFAAATTPIEKFERILPTLLQSEEFIQYFQQLAVSSLPATLNSIRQRFQNELGSSRAPVIPPLPPLINLPDGNLTLNLPDLYGDFALWNQTIEDFSTIQDALDIQIVCDPILGLSAAFDLFLPSIYLRGDQILDLALGADNITGNGKYHIGVTDTKFDADLIISFIHGAPDKLQISHLVLDVLVGKLDLFAENFVIGGFPIEGDMWESLSANLKLAFESLWPTIKEPLAVTVTDVVNGIIKDCGIIDYLAFILGSGDLSCLNPTIPAAPSKPSLPLLAYFELLTSATDFLEDTLPRIHEFPLAQNLAKSFLTSIFAHRDAKAPVFPVFPDPAYPEDLVLPIDLGFLLANISMQDSTIVGLSTIKDDLAIGVSLVPFGVVANFTLSELGQTVTVEMNGTHTSEFDLNLAPISPILLLKSSGKYNVGIKEAFLRLGVIVGVQTGSLTKIEIKRFDLSMGFDQFVLYAHKVWAGDCFELPAYWQGIEEFIKRIFDIIWTNNPRQDIITDYVKQVLNSVIKECTITNILDFIAGNGDLACLSDPVFPPIPTFPPITTTTMVSTTVTTTDVTRTTTPQGSDPTTTSPATVTTTTDATTTTGTTRTTTPQGNDPTTSADVETTIDGGTTTSSPTTTPSAAGNLSTSLISVLVICFLAMI